MEKVIEMHGGKVWGIEPSGEALEHGRLDYATLAKMLDGCILNNEIYGYVYQHGGGWDIVNGDDYNEETDEYADVYQYYVISPHGAEVLKRFTDEIVYYREELDMHLWGVQHFGTAWDHVLTGVKLVSGDGIAPVRPGGHDGREGAADMKLAMRSQYTFQEAMGHPEDPEPMTTEEMRSQIRLWKGEVTAAIEGSRKLATDELRQLEAFLETLASAEVEYERPVGPYRYHAGFEYWNNFEVLAETPEQADQIARDMLDRMAEAMPAKLNESEGRFEHLEQDDCGRSMRLVEREA